MKNDAEKTVSDSAAEAVQVVLPNDTNPLGNVLGGRVMHWIDMIAAVVAYRHSRCPVVTASMERLEFHIPIRLGQVAILKARLNFVGRTSMEVGVDVFSEDPLSAQRLKTSTAILTYVALDAKGRPTNVPRLRLETEDERRRFSEGEARYQETRRRRGRG
ncbi:MAG TPA: acyl-CoA thioesterase [Nitrospiria bacterium]